MRVAPGLSITAFVTLALLGCSDPVANAPASHRTEPYIWATAVIGAVTCNDSPTVPVTLQNTASSEPVVFFVEGWVSGANTRLFAKATSVPAGEGREVAMPVRDHQQLSVRVYKGPLDADGEPERFLAMSEIDVACTPAPVFKADATVGKVRCSDHTLPVKLDNRGSEVVAEFWVYGSSSGERLEFDRRYRIPPGTRRIIHVPVGDNLFEFNAQVSGPLGTEGSWPYNDYRFKVACP